MESLPGLTTFGRQGTTTGSAVTGLGNVAFGDDALTRLTDGSSHITKDREMGIDEREAAGSMVGAFITN